MKTNLDKRTIKIAIHHIVGSSSDRWIEYCQQHKVPYKIVDCTKSDIIDQLRDCDGLMWHWGQMDYRHLLFARQLTYSLEKIGKKVFPSSSSCWHFDDKVGQKYLFEATGLPLIKSYVFYRKEDAIEWINVTTFPKVFKLRSGAGSFNVELIKSKKQAKKKINIAFGRGFPAYSRRKDLGEKLRKLLLNKDKHSFIKLLKSVFRLFHIKNKDSLLPREKGYVYFQEFIPNKNIDTRIIICGDRCFGTTRYVRKNDFRASGSGIEDNSPDLIDKRIINKAFEVYDRIGSQITAFDFLQVEDDLKIIEISYGFPVIPSDGLPGYWDRQLNWHEGLFKSQYWMIENFIKEIQ